VLLWKMSLDGPKKRSTTADPDEARAKKKTKREEPIQKEEIEEAIGGQSTSKAAQYESIFSASFTNQRATPALVKEMGKKNAELKRLKKQVGDFKLHESALVMRLLTKEQEIHRLQTELQDMKSCFTRTHKEMREIMLDRTVNILFQRMKDQLKDTKDKLKQSQEDLGAATFTRECAAGRALINRIRMLQKENEDLGAQLSEGNIHKLQLENSTQKEFIEELKQYLNETNVWVSQLDEELDKKYVNKQL